MFMRALAMLAASSRAIRASDDNARSTRPGSLELYSVLDAAGIRREARVVGQLRRFKHHAQKRAHSRSF